ncbi:hypothetical protein MMPV_003759 [Pyropia vietnamensis]
MAPVPSSASPSPLASSTTTYDVTLPLPHPRRARRRALSPPVAADTDHATETHSTLPPTDDGVALHLTTWARASPLPRTRRGADAAVTVATPAADGTVRAVVPLPTRAADGSAAAAAAAATAPLSPLLFLVIHHGLGEYGTRYARVVSTLFARLPALVAVYAHDARGHGRSPGSRGVVPGGVPRLAKDFTTTVLPAVAAAATAARRDGQREGEGEPRSTPVRVVLFGQSLGGLTLVHLAAGPAAAVTAALGADAELAGVILSAPALRVAMMAPVKAAGVAVAAGVSRLGGAALPVPTGITPDLLTSSEEEQARVAADPLLHTRTCVAVGGDLLSGGEALLASLRGEVTTPGPGMSNAKHPRPPLSPPPGRLAAIPGLRFLILHSPADPLVAHAASVELAAALSAAGAADVTLTSPTRAQARHEWMWETVAAGRNEWHAAVAAFLGEAVGAGGDGRPGNNRPANSPEARAG